jgi:GNAT superfamily N-acetyltransferase
MNERKIREAKSDEDIARCFDVVSQLRTHLAREAFVARVRLQEEGGYRLAFLEDRGEIVAAAGYRLIENLSAGRILYVDDLVTDADNRSRGYGARLLRWLGEVARQEGCAKLDLDSGVQRKDAHRFYHAQGMVSFAHHFRLEL